MINYYYFKLNLIFIIPILIFLFIYFIALISRYIKYILFCSFLGTIYFFIVDPVATGWKAWEYNYNRTFGIRFGLSAAEELMWAILVFFTLSIVISVLAECEEKNLKFRNLFQKNELFAFCNFSSC